ASTRVTAARTRRQRGDARRNWLIGFSSHPGHASGMHAPPAARAVPGRTLADDLIMTFKKILCPIDFSAGSQQAMRVAIHLANEAGAELVLAHAWHIPPMAYGGEYAFAEELMVELRDDAQRALDAAILEAEALGAKRPAARLLVGSPRHEIVRVL